MSSLLSLTPAALSAQKNLRITNLDLNKSLARFEESGKSFIAMGNFKINKNAFKLLLKGEITTNGINVQEFNKTPNYSLGLQLDDEKDLDSFEKLNDFISQFLEDHLPNAEDWDLNRVVKDDRIYLKLKTDPKKNFQFTSNVKVTPKNLTEQGLFRGQKVEVIAEIAPYFNFMDRKAGLSITPRSIKFETEEEEEPAPKKIRKD